MESRAEVLMFIDWYLPGYKAGGPIRSCANLVQHLSSDIRFSIVTSDRDYLSQAAYPSVGIDEWVEGEFGERIWYASIGAYDSKLIQRLYQEQSYQCVYIHGIFSSRYSILPLRTLIHRSADIIVAPRGMLRSSALAIKKNKKLAYLTLAKLMGWYRRVRFHATDEQEAKDIAQVFGEGRSVTVAPNLASKASSAPQAITKRQGSIQLIFAGRIAPEKNLAYALDVLAHIPAGHHVTLSIYGALYDISYWEECQALIAALPEHIEVIYHGVVSPADLQVAFAQHHALFLPTRGENFGHSILESLIAGRPVIISDQTPWRGLSAEGIGYDIALDDQRAFVKEILAFTDLDQASYDAFAERASERGIAYSSDPAIVSASKALFLPPDGNY